MVKIERTPIPPPSLAKEALKANGSYEEKDVVYQLRHDFYGKCYICELGNLTDPQVEHLLPHYNRKRKDRVFDWNNLFYVCPHCNSIKNNRKYDEKIIDCCKENPEKYMNHTLEDGHVKILVSSFGKSREDAKITADLIQNCFEKSNKGIREVGSQERFRRLSNKMNMLYKILDKLEHKQITKIDLQALRSILSKKYEFAAFTRYYVRIHLDKYPELIEYLDDKESLV